MSDLHQIEADKKMLEEFGYKQELSRSLKLFAIVAFTYLSPVVDFIPFMLLASRLVVVPSFGR